MSLYNKYAGLRPELAEDVPEEYLLDKEKVAQHTDAEIDPIEERQRQIYDETLRKALRRKGK